MKTTELKKVFKNFKNYPFNYENLFLMSNIMCLKLDWFDASIIKNKSDKLNTELYTNFFDITKTKRDCFELYSYTNMDDWFIKIKNKDHVIFELNKDFEIIKIDKNIIDLIWLFYDIKEITIFNIDATIAALYHKNDFIWIVAKIKI